MGRSDLGSLVGHFAVVAEYWGLGILVGHIVGVMVQRNLAPLEVVASHYGQHQWCLLVVW